MLKRIGIWVMRYPYSWRKTGKLIGTSAVSLYLGKRLYDWSSKFTNTYDGLMKIRERYECRNDNTEHFNMIMYNTNIYPQPLLQVVPRDEDEFKNLLVLCNTRGLAVAFWDKEKYSEGKIAKRVLRRPFITIDLSKLNTVVRG